jgi:hypothetical protein
MKNFILFSIVCAGLMNLLVSCSEVDRQLDREVIYIWSHNDYEQERPLFQALELGYQMIEADIHLIDGNLYVSHDHPEDLERTPLLQDLYLDPLAEHIERMDGEVLPESDVPFYLVIDVKTEAETTYRVLTDVLEPYRELFTRKKDGEFIHGPVRLLISGNRPQLTEDEPDRIALIDGRIPDIGTGLSSDVYPMISDNWNNYFNWDGTGEMPAEEYEELVSITERVHEEGKMIRFWATPDLESVWEVLLDAGVDVINVDDLQGLHDFLQDKRIRM